MLKKFNYGWEIWIGHLLKVAWVKSTKWAFDCSEGLVYIRLGHLEVNTAL